jgi:hypothetical protein
MNLKEGFSLGIGKTMPAYSDKEKRPVDQRDRVPLQAGGVPKGKRPIRCSNYHGSGRWLRKR